MKWRGARRSANVEDRRGRSIGRTAGRAGGGLGLVAAALLVVSLFFPDAAPFLRPLIGALQGGEQTLGGPVSVEPGQPSRDDDTYGFVAATLGYTEEVWAEIFAAGRFGSTTEYQPPILVLYEGQTPSPCGQATAQAGPFYCPADQKIYIDPAFYRVMETQLKAPGDFAQAYVIAHEVAHHVQMQLGLLMQVNRRRAALDAVEGNRLTVRLELQADCFSGVWARRADAQHQILERGDLQEALNAAYQVGDDVLMRLSGRRVDPSQFTHGSAEQRARWFRVGYESGQVERCDTFSQNYDRL